MTDLELYSYAYHIDKYGASLKEMNNLSELERLFYTASMLVMRDERAEDQIALAKLTGEIANPFIKVGGSNG